MVGGDPSKGACLVTISLLTLEMLAKKIQQQYNYSVESVLLFTT